MPTGLIDFIAGSISAFLLTFVNTTSQNFINAITPLVAICVSIWVIVYGIAVVRGQVQDVATDFLWRAVKIVIILSLALGIGNYQTTIVPAAYGLRDGLVAATTVTGVVSPPTTMYGALDRMDVDGAKYEQKMFAEGLFSFSVGGIGKMLAALGMSVCIAILLAVNTAFIIIVDVAFSFILALGPIFIATLAFTPVAKYFDAWIGKVINYVILSVLLTMAISIEMQLFIGLIARLDAGIATTTLISSVISVVVITISLLVVIYQMPTIAAGLAGGSALSGAGQAIANLVTGGAAKAIRGGSGGSGSGANRGGGGSIKQGGGAAYQAGRAVGTAAQGAGAAASAASNLTSRTPAYMRAALNRVRK
jgi:type IV secretion system protein VirB6